jgi:signal transduction histidine kinase
MRLIEFIANHHKSIIDGWVSFARSREPAATAMDDTALRDHSEELLTAIVNDMDSPQSAREQAEKSKGRGEVHALESVGVKHAIQRLQTGFRIDQLVSEYRALRANVLQQWAKDQGDEQRDVTRFNEAIDEALTEATNGYAAMLDRTREQFLAILGHDLRNPLSSIIMGASLLIKTDSAQGQPGSVAMRILSSGRRMERMISDILDLTRTRLGDGIPIVPQQMNLELLCRQVIAELQTAQPSAVIELEAKGELWGEWDNDRLAQVVSNLVGNALQHGSPQQPVQVRAIGDGKEIVLSVHNQGPAIPSQALATVFEPMMRQPTKGRPNLSSMGLGLYIAREVVSAHGGTIDVVSSLSEGTTFTVHLPYCLPST